MFKEIGQHKKMESTDERLLTFLKTLTSSLEKGELCTRQVQSIGEFFMSYQFREQAVTDRTEYPQFNQTDLIKFITLGWYVYQVLLTKEELD